MKFGQAIDSVLFKNYFNLEGKASRSEYWWFMLFIYSFQSLCCCEFIVGISSWNNFPRGRFYIQTLSLFTYTLGLLAVFILPLLGLSVRRFADAGRGRREAIGVFVLAIISQLIVPMGAQGAIIQVAEFLIMPAWIVYGATSLYTLYIALKKSV